jgi:hypothetical protein
LPDLPPEFLDPGTPPDVVVTDLVRPRFDDPTLGVPLGIPDPDVPGPGPDPAHRLVTVGDSLTHGVLSAAVFRTDLSWPVIAAQSLGIERLAVPTYGGPLGGLPLNLEGLLRKLEDEFGRKLGPVELVSLPFVLHDLLDANEDYWERGPGSAPPPAVHHENVGILGWDVRDSLSYTAARAVTRIAGHPARDDFLGVKPSNDDEILARSVLEPFGPAAAQIDAAAWHGRNGGIETLVVALGANNALRTVVDKRVEWSGPGFDDLDVKDRYTVWRPTDFAVEYAALVAAVRTIGARRVVLATVPHVTIAPIAQGVNPENPGRKWRPGSRYFPYYTDPWIEEDDFRPDRHRHLTHQQARAIDSAIDQYNDTIAAAVRAARAEGRDWLLFDLCAVLDGLAHRRFEDDPAAAVRNGWQPYRLPEPLGDLDTRFFRSDRHGRSQGGLFGLDGVHPTTSAYGIVASAFLDVLAAGGVPSVPVDFARLAREDTLNHEPPALMDAVFSLLTPFLARLVSRARIPLVGSDALVSDRALGDGERRRPGDAG